MVIPAILAKTKKEFKHKIKIVMPFCDTVQLDIMDGIFVPNETWGDPDEVEHLHLPLAFEVHLMTEEPELIIEEWAGAGAFRIIFHIEATKKPEECIRQIKKFRREAGVAINPKTPLAKIKNLLSGLDYVLVMGVDPGFSGQRFQPAVLKKIKSLKKIAPNIKIAVDGGVNQANAREIQRAGADFLCAASALFKAKNIQKAMERLGG